MNQVLGLSLTISIRSQDPRTFKETELRVSSVLAKVDLNEGGRKFDLILTNLSSYWFFSRIREKLTKTSLGFETRVSFLSLRVRVSPIASYL